MKTYGVPRTVDGQDTARAKDWLTALSPLLLMMVVNYRWSAVLAVPMPPLWRALEMQRRPAATAKRLFRR